MNKINCRIISINPDNSDNFNSVQDMKLGHESRYIKRRENINNYITNSKNKDKFNFEFLDAVTPNNFTMENGNIIYKEKNIISDRDDIFYMSNTLSHYEIWNIEEDTLIFEDDVLLNDDVFSKLYETINEFNLIKSSTGKILYLQLTTPWNGTEKTFSLQSVTDNIGKYINGDISGTAAYYISKETKKILLDNLRPLNACDAYLDRLQRDKIFEYYIPNDKTKMFELDKDTMSL